VFAAKLTCRSTHSDDLRLQYEVLIVRQSFLNSSAMSFDEGKEKDLDSIWRTQDRHAVDYWIDFFTVSGVSPRSARLASKSGSIFLSLNPHQKRPDFERPSANLPSIFSLNSTSVMM
jgi:hypothetical protein